MSLRNLIHIAPDLPSAVMPREFHGHFPDVVHAIGSMLARLEVVAAKLYGLLGRPRPDQAGDVLTIRQAAAFCALSPTKIRREIKSSRLPASNAGSDARPLYRILKSDLLVWLERKKGGIKVPPKADLKTLVNRYFPER